MTVQGDRVTFSSGKEFRANRGIVGLAPDSAAVYDGYDGTFACGEDGQTSLSLDECKELAEYMTDLWSKWLSQRIEEFYDGLR